MKAIPQLKELKYLNGRCDVKNIEWIFSVGIDDRIVSAAKRICESNNNGTKVYINHGNGNDESYTLDINVDNIKISSLGPRGAFYGLMTLKMLKKTSDNMINCCHIVDFPDMEYRGFYHDVTRGKVPNLDTLKNLADIMADYKLNSLQLYIEHTYEFKEYDFCLDRLGFLTKDEIKELDKYCKDRFIELIPSIATFGHLYHLLNCDKYKHLCELKNYKPKKNYYIEKMEHHTINPLMDESYKLITSLIDQHMEAFSSNKFNICCDETFDLGTDVNKGMDKSELYVGFVKKLINHLESKGKTVMMWGDIILKYPERLLDISDKVIFLNWDYAAEPIEKNVAAMKDVTQIVCPGTSSWEGFHEVTHTEENNIITLATYGAKYGAKGILNTNWGDLGNPASIAMGMYGLILGACVGWNIGTKANEELKVFISKYHYGCDEALSILDSLCEYNDYVSWLVYNWDNRLVKNDSKECFLKAMDNCHSMINKIKNSTFKDEDMRNKFLLSAEGDSLIVSWNAKKYGHIIKSNVNFNDWISRYRADWMKESKKAELDTLTNMFKDING